MQLMTSEVTCFIGRDMDMFDRYTNRLAEWLAVHSLKNKFEKVFRIVLFKMIFTFHGLSVLLNIWVPKVPYFWKLSFRDNTLYLSTFSQ